MVTKILAAEWARYGIRVNSLAPSFIRTKILEEADESLREFSEAKVRRVPMGRPGKPEELVGAAVYLASDASSYMTGSRILLDGGYTAC